VSSVRDPGSSALVVRTTRPENVFWGNSLIEMVAVCPGLMVLANACGTLMKIRSLSIRAIWNSPPEAAGEFVPVGVVPLPGKVALEAVVPTEELTLLPLPVRVNDLAMPETTIVDLRLELRAGNRGTLSRALRLALERAVAKGDQAILYLNRRGFATIVLCRDCGYVVPCPACEIPFAYHLDGSLVCHRCGRRGIPPEVCPQCGGRRIRHLGVGTQRVEEEVRSAVPKAETFRASMATTMHC